MYILLSTFKSNRVERLTPTPKEGTTFKSSAPLSGIDLCFSKSGMWTVLFLGHLLYLVKLPLIRDKG